MDLRVAPHVCALHDVSPRDRWLCVLPGGQMNVNVNVKWRHGRKYEYRSRHQSLAR